MGHAAFVVLLAASLSVSALALPAAADDSAGEPTLEVGALERTECGWIRESLMGWLWSSMAGAANPEGAARVPGVEAIEHRTDDGRLLHGYRMRPAGPVRGTLLVAQGNAMLADHLLGYLDNFTRSGFDVHVFDYRGYGDSEGRPRLAAIVHDYTRLAEHLRATSDGPLHLYGISFGGIVLMNVIGTGTRFEAAVIDSSPARISSYGCPVARDPAEHVPEDASRILVIAGDRDSVVPGRDVQELIDGVRERGGRGERRSHFAHPFMDTDPSVHRERTELIRAFLLTDRRTPAASR